MGVITLKSLNVTTAMAVLVAGVAGVWIGLYYSSVRADIMKTKVAPSSHVVAEFTSWFDDAQWMILFVIPINVLLVELLLASVR